MSLPVPTRVFEQHIIVLGKTRSGKSSAMRLLVENLLDHQKPVTIIDPKGDWWGLKSSASGKSAGFPVVIFGGEHGDVPLNARSGAHVAELVATGNRSCIVDLGGWMPGDRTQFWIDFASTYFRLHRGRHYLVIDEVHNLCPKGKIMDPNAGRMLHWSNRLASEGLGKGISMLAASQRPQKVHNDFLTSCETLIGMRVIHKADRDAIGDWIDGCGDSEKGSDVLRTIASMRRGEAWVWSPEIEFGPKQIQFPMFRTFDSFKPQPPGKRSRLKGWADVDLVEVRKKLEAVVKEAEAKDPGRLTARIRQLERELREKPAPVQMVIPPKEQDARVSKAVYESNKRVTEHFDGEIRKVKDYAVYLEDRLKALRQTLERSSKEIGGHLNRMTIENRKMPQVRLGFTVAIPRIPAGEIQRKEMLVRPERPTSRRVESPPRPEYSEPTGELTKMERVVLKVLAELRSLGHENPEKEQTAAWSGSSIRSGSFTTAIAALKLKGLVVYPARGTISATSEGIALAGDVVPPTRDAFIERMRLSCSKFEFKVFSFLMERENEKFSKQDVAEQCGSSIFSGTFTTAIASLRAKGVIEYPERGYLRASAWIFL